MPFIPHTEQDVQAMLRAIGGVRAIADLFDEIPAELKIDGLAKVPAQLNEMEVGQLMRRRAAQDRVDLNFAGAGSYEHHIPAAVWEITTRGEFYSAYTPYQAEASQGTLQLIYEYQTMMARLTGMDASNASLYDGASALAEAVLMAERARGRQAARRVLVPAGVHPAYRIVLESLIGPQGIEIHALPFDPAGGHLDPDWLAKQDLPPFSALVIPQPNYFGVLEEVDALTRFAHSREALVVAVVNPLSLAVLTPPGRWGDTGADIVCGDGQPLGVPMSSGGPYFGFLCCRESLLRQMPGRIVGRTTDIDGRDGFALTLQAREQHIRRAKATSNICTNQGLLVTAATIHMALLGPEGLANAASACMANARRTDAVLSALPGVRPLFDRPYFHERAYRLPVAADTLIARLAQDRIVAGVDLGRDFQPLSDALLVCTTETKSDADIRRFGAAFATALG